LVYLSEPQELNGLDGGVIGGVVGGVIIILVIILGILFFMRKKGNIYYHLLERIGIN
jgi:Ca2+/Na+ antiporter